MAALRPAAFHPLSHQEGAVSMKRPIQPLLCIAMALAAMAAFSPVIAVADDAPSPCAALKRIVAAAPDGFTGLSPAEVNGVAQPYGDDAQCNASHDSYQCLWTPHHDAGSSADALQSVAADVASCLPEATHDLNTPARQHFYVGPRDKRTQITATTAGPNKLKLTVSGK
jgi:hypothetical protein